MKCVDDEYKADKKMEPFVIPVLSNDSKLSVPFEIKFMEQPENGEIEIAETTDKFGRATTGSTPLNQLMWKTGQKTHSNIA